MSGDRMSDGCMEGRRVDEELMGGEWIVGGCA